MYWIIVVLSVGYHTPMRAVTLPHFDNVNLCSDAARSYRTDKEFGVCVPVATSSGKTGISIGPGFVGMEDPIAEFNPCSGYYEYPPSQTCKN